MTRRYDLFGWPVLVLLLCTTASSSSVNPNFSKVPSAWAVRKGWNLQIHHYPTTGVALTVRGGASDATGREDNSDNPPKTPPDGKKKKSQKGATDNELTDNEVDEEEDEDNWHDAQEEEDIDDIAALEEEEDEEEPEEWVEVFDSDQEDNEEEEDDDFVKVESTATPLVDDEEEEVEEVSLAEVLVDEAIEDTSIALDVSNDNDDDQEEESFVDALEDIEEQVEEDIIDDIDSVLVTSSLSTAPSINTDDESSSASVDRMDLADAYDVEEEEEEEVEGAVLVTGDEDEEDTQQSTSPAAPQEIAPGGGGTDDDTNVETATEEQVEAAAVGETTQEITPEMKQALQALRWRKREIKHMRPDIAAAVLHKQLQRPREGMPALWYTTTPTTKTVGQLGKVLKTVLVPFCVGVAIYAGSEIVDWNDCGKSLQTMSSKVASSIVPKQPVVESQAESTPQEEEEEEDSSESVPVTPEAAVTEEQPVKATTTADDLHPHSVKPGSHQVEDVQDHSWLDKIITKFENALKAIWNKEL